MTERATLAWKVFVLATEPLPKVKREAMRKLVRAFGDARYEQGRAVEAGIAREDDLAAQQRELQRRIFERARA